MRNKLKLSEAIIAWSPIDAKGKFKKTAGQVRVGPLIEPTEQDWTADYASTGGAAFIAVRRLRGGEAKIHVLKEFVKLVTWHGIDPEIAAQALSNIEEFAGAFDEHRRPSERKTIRPSRTA
ncbi:MAG TPA: hypothetical protein VG501_08465 [Rhizomicrobium sp.]|nr:hypothetical protein [Rhizomicrobium sp.]